MSELETKESDHLVLQRRLLTTVSALALLTSVTAGVAGEDDSNHPTVWIELGGQLERNDGTGAPFTAPFMSFKPTPPTLMDVTPVDVQRPPRYSKGGEASIFFYPAGTDWVFAASVRYGRSNGNKSVNEQTAHIRSKYVYPGVGYQPLNPTQQVAQFTRTTVESSESHVVLDFRAGKDVGLGMFGRNSTSTISAGVRFAQFVTRSNVEVRARQNFKTENVGPSPFYFPNMKFHTYHLMANSDRSFQGVGPSLSWQASSSVMGDIHDGELAVDWVLNGAVLFGRQKARLHHQSTDSYNKGLKYFPSSPHAFTHYKHYPAVIGNPRRSRSVVIPNIGATVGLTYRIENFRLSAGYRADFFFGAIDGGIDQRQNYDRSFYGPFASFSVGLGG